MVDSCQLTSHDSINHHIAERTSHRSPRGTCRELPALAGPACARATVLEDSDPPRLLWLLQQVGDGEVQVPGDALELVNAPGDLSCVPQRHRRTGHPEDLCQIRLGNPNPRRLEAHVSRHDARQRLLTHRPAGRAWWRVQEREPLSVLPTLFEVLLAVVALRATRVVNVAIRTPPRRWPHAVHHPLLPQTTSAGSGCTGRLAMVVRRQAVSPQRVTSGVDNPLTSARFRRRWRPGHRSGAGSGSAAVCAEGEQQGEAGVGVGLRPARQRRAQAKTTVRCPLSSTRCSVCQRTACARTRRSTSCPLACSTDTESSWPARVTSCSMIGPSSRSAVT